VTDPSRDAVGDALPELPGGQHAPVWTSNAPLTVLAEARQNCC